MLQNIHCQTYIDPNGQEQIPNERNMKPTSLLSHNFLQFNFKSSAHLIYFIYQNSRVRMVFAESHISK